jgi:excisionase family DNA binding protein
MNVEDTNPNKLTPTWGLKEAAIYLRAAPDTVRKLASDRKIPAAKVGRAWVFMPHLLAEYLEKKSRSTDALRVLHGGSVLAARLDARLAQRSAQMRTKGEM